MCPAQFQGVLPCAQPRLTDQSNPGRKLLMRMLQRCIQRRSKLRQPASLQRLLFRYYMHFDIHCKHYPWINLAAYAWNINQQPGSIHDI